MTEGRKRDAKAPSDVKNVSNAKEDDVDKLFVLGAGASFAASRPNKQWKNRSTLPKKQSPLDKNFIKALRNRKSKKATGWQKSLYLNLERDWEALSKLADYGLEEAIRAHESRLLFKNEILKPPGRRTRKFDLFLRDLLWLIPDQLYSCKEGREKIYEKFVSTYFQNLKSTRNHILSFNYDTLLDRCLHSKNNNSWNKIYPDFIGQNTPKTKFPIYLKLHGSINWRVNKADFDKMLSGHEISQIFLQGRRFPPPKNSTAYPCIIPPIQSKPIAHIEQFRIMWKLAGKYLSNCNELYIIGYSLPEADGLASALFRTTKNNNLNKITIIDPDIETLGKWHKMLKNRNLKNQNGKAPEFHYLSDFADLF